MNYEATPSLNLASFLTTYMEPEVSDLMSEQMTKNLIDQDEYPQVSG
jgi:glutamate decarboxylase